MKALIVVPFALAALAACNRPDADHAADRGSDPDDEPEAPIQRVELAGFPPDTEFVAWSPDESVLVVRHSKRCAYYRLRKDVIGATCVFTAEAVDVTSGSRTLLTRDLIDDSRAPSLRTVVFAPDSRHLMVRGVAGVPERDAGATELRDSSALTPFQERVDVADGTRVRPTRSGSTSSGMDGARWGPDWWWPTHDHDDVIRVSETAGWGRGRVGFFRQSTGQYASLPEGINGDWWNTDVAPDGNTWYYVPEGGGLWAAGFDDGPRTVAQRVNAVSVSADRSLAIVRVGDPPGYGASPVVGERRIVTLPDFKPAGPVDADECTHLFFDGARRHLICRIDDQAAPRVRIWNTQRKRWVPDSGFTGWVDTVNGGDTIVYHDDRGPLCAVAAAGGATVCAGAPKIIGVEAQPRIDGAGRTVWCGAPYAYRCVAVDRRRIIVSGEMGPTTNGTVVRALAVDGSGDLVHGMTTGRTGPVSTTALWAWRLSTNTVRVLRRGPEAAPVCTPRGVCLWRADPPSTAATFVLLNDDAPPDRRLRVGSFAGDTAPLVLLGSRRIALTQGDGTLRIEPVDAFGDAVPPTDEPAGGDLDWDAPIDGPGLDR